MDARFFGVWTLDPSTCAYGDEPPPKSGTYTMLPEGGDIWFHVRWLNAKDEPFEVSYRGTVGKSVSIDDGSKRKLMTHFDGEVLVTEVLERAEVVRSAHRYLEDDALTVVQRDGDVERTAVYHPTDVKQVLVYRRDLAMRKGKIAAQCAHASMAVFFQRNEGPMDRLSVPLDGPMAVWVRRRFGKVVLSVEGEEALLKIHALATERGVPCALITDSGKTEFKGQPTRTTVALGPAAAPEIDAITGPEGLVPTKLA